jgi:hypothetical protein
MQSTMTKAQGGEDPKSRFWVDSLQIFALCGFAFAQPVYDLLGRSAEFFVAQRMGPASILTFVVALSVGLPALLALILAAIGRGAPRLHRVCRLLLVFGLSVLIALPILKRVPGLSGLLVLGASVGAGAMVALAYAMLPPVRSFMTLLSPAGLAFPILFLFFTPVSNLIAPHATAVAEKVAPSGPAAAIENPAPVIFVIFDEFEASSLLDANQNIDAARFPNIGAFARDALWFPHATAVWTETQRAVPAILTGLRPHDPAALPTVQSHPNNLFTWMKSSGYKLNVVEPLTSLCPKEDCPPRRGEVADDFDGTIFLSDLAVLYLHVVLPRSAANRLLPRMDASWRGFALGGGQRPATGPNGEKNFRAEFHDIVTNDRKPLVENFIKSIGPETKSLNFLHILLPHDPYLYLPSGTMYPGGNTEGLVDRSWTTDEVLPTLAYHRFLLQVGFVDTMIGELVKHLKEQGIYDSALIVLTADHGKAFRTGLPKRTLVGTVKDNAPELLGVPLFIKLPGKAQHGRNERRAVTTDILPTVADVLGTKLPWKADGVSLLSPTFPSRDVLEILPVGEGNTFTFDAKELTSYPRLPWKIAKFGSGTPLDSVFVADSNAALVGEAVADLRIADEAPGLKVVSDTYGLLQNVQPATGVVPALFQGTLQSEGKTRTAAPLRLAISLNGIVRATTRTTNWLGSPYYFAVMLPESGFRQGENLVEVFKIDDSNGQPSLKRIAAPGQGLFTLSDDGGEEHLVSSTHETIPIRSGSLEGVVDLIEDYSRWLTVVGWAVNKEKLIPASTILVFVDGVQAYAGRPSVSRDDLVTHFHAPGVVGSGFRLNVPKGKLQGRDTDVRIFALSDSGVASEVSLGPAAEAAVQRLSQ